MFGQFVSRSVDAGYDTKADKGNATVIIDKDNYHKKIMTLLGDKTYHKTKRNPTTRVENATKKLINQTNTLDDKTKKWITPSD